jgi:hypothetical protein
VILDLNILPVPTVNQIQYKPITAPRTHDGKVLLIRILSSIYVIREPILLKRFADLLGKFHFQVVRSLHATVQRSVEPGTCKQ